MCIYVWSVRVLVRVVSKFSQVWCFSKIIVSLLVLFTYDTKNRTIILDIYLTKCCVVNPFQDYQFNAFFKDLSYLNSARHLINAMFFVIFKLKYILTFYYDGYEKCSCISASLLRLVSQRVSLIVGLLWSNIFEFIQFYNRKLIWESKNAIQIQFLIKVIEVYVPHAQRRPHNKVMKWNPQLQSPRLLCNY